MQSPIAIIEAFRAKGPVLKFDYKPSPLRMSSNGRIVQADYAPSSTLTIAGEVFELLQFHFHVPSEHTMAGKLAAMEAHFVHRNAAGELAVVGVMMRSGAHNEPLAPVFENMPSEAGAEISIAGATIDASAVLPSETRAYFHYKGSLTTPPCSEGVHWFVLAHPIEVSLDQIRTLERILGANSRPLQSLDHRLLLGSPLQTADR